MCKKKKNIIIIIGIILIFSGLSFYFFSSVIYPPSNFPDSLELSYGATQTTTVYDFMNQLRSEGKINFIEKNYTGMGKFIISLNGVKGNGKENWIYYVNGEKAQVGVSNYKINPGDIVSWKYEKANF